MKTTHLKSWYKLVIAITLSQLAGVIGSIFTGSAISEWYAFLEKPVFSPPNWVFAPVWIILYTLMGIAFYLIWERGVKNRDTRNALYFFLAHLCLNASWSIIFFALRSPESALVNIIVLWSMIAILVAWFYRIYRIAGILLIPYLIWVSFATALNAAIIILN